MTTRLQQEIERWETELRAIAESSESDDWFLEERRLAEATHACGDYFGGWFFACSMAKTAASVRRSTLSLRSRDET